MPSKAKSSVQVADPNRRPVEFPLTVLLSEVLVAFTMEFDNEFERMMPHWTTESRKAGGARSGPWLVSMAGWYFMRSVRDDGVTVKEMEASTVGATLPLVGMERWGYVVVDRSSPEGQPKLPQREWLVRPSRKGRLAREVWRPLFGEIERRWRGRFGGDVIQELKNRLSAVSDQFELELPDFLPVLGYGLFARLGERPGRQGADFEVDSSLPALLSKPLLAVTVEFERDWPVSLPVAMNGLRILTEEGVPLRELPRLAGVSKEAIGFVVSFLQSQEYVEVTTSRSGRPTKLIRLTGKGVVAKAANSQRLAGIEASFRSRFGAATIDALHRTLQDIVYRREGDQSVLAQGLTPNPGGWRGRKPYLKQTLDRLADPSGNLPHYPMVLHRGGFPDGS
jgi:hypothetical protein